MTKPIRWAYGLTTTHKRFDELLPLTIKSLVAAGFDCPRLFVDGPGELPTGLKHLEVSRRDPVIRTYGNWVLTAWELYLRDPNAQRYAIFQDDFVTYRNLRQYLESCEFPHKQGYWNLYTFPENQMLCPENHQGWYESNQLGKGAVALIFDNEGIQKLLTHPHMIGRPQDVKRGWRYVDGGIVDSMRKLDRKEYVHSPSLVQHTGIMSSMGNRVQPLANSFRGEDFDAMELLR